MINADEVTDILPKEIGKVCHISKQHNWGSYSSLPVQDVVSIDSV